MGFYVESADRPKLSGIAQEDIHLGAVIARTGAGQVSLTDDSDTAADGVAAAPRRGAYIADESDESTNFLYESADDDRVPYQTLDEAGAICKVRTITDNNTDPSPSISDGDVVGVAQKDDDAFRGRVVEEGYTDNGSTTYNTGSDNFTVVGTVYRDSASGFDEAVRIEVDN